MWCDVMVLMMYLVFSTLYCILYCTALIVGYYPLSTSDTTATTAIEDASRITVQSKSKNQSKKRRKRRERQINWRRMEWHDDGAGGFLFQFWAKKPVAQRTPHHTLNSRSAVSIKSIQIHTYVEVQYSISKWHHFIHFYFKEIPVTWSRQQQNDDKVLWWIQRGRAAA